MLAAYEAVSIALYAAVFAWALYSRNPINVGALIGGFLMFGFDWFWVSRGFWNATFNQDLIMIPGIDILGQQYPISVACTWGLGFGFLPLLVSQFHWQIGRALGAFHLPMVMLACALIDIAIESLLISGLQVYEYHQAPQYELLGMIWSNTWMLGGVLVAGYFGLAYARKWTAFSSAPGLSLASENTWKGLALSGGVIMSAAAFLSFAQLFWFTATHPWIESGRLF